MNDVRTLIEIGDFIGHVYKQNSKPASRYYYLTLCNRFADFSQRLVKSAIVFNIFLTSFFFLAKLGESLYTEKMVLAFEIHFPGLNEESMVAFSVLMLYNYVGGMIVFLISGIYNILLFLIFANMPMVSSVIVGHLDELKDVLLDPGCQYRDVRSRFTNIIRMHNKYNEYDFPPGFEPSHSCSSRSVLWHRPPIGTERNG